MIWFISDTHFSHKRIAEYTGRPLNHEKLMWEGLDIIEQDDILIHCGDVAFSQTAKNLLETFNRLPGAKKYLIIGNHDRKETRSLPWNFCEKELKLQYEEFKIYVKHKPYITEEIQTIYKDYHILIHGHVHEIGNPFQVLNNKIIFNVSVEQWEYKPISIEQIAQITRKELCTK